jgi:glutamate/tyrosine decarboxylase-like PLP-dependent enzyme
MIISINLDYRKYGIGIMVISINLDYHKYGIKP